MEIIEVRTESTQAPVELTIRSTDPAECPTCVSGVDPTIGSGLFQEALHEGL